ncbi:MAG: amidase domain-containing protein [Buchananella hordeovulneris]|nr:amidase domain-containing protein [Buchananella hordeovulneris]
MATFGPILLAAATAFGLFAPTTADDVIEERWRSDTQEVALLDVFIDPSTATKEFKASNQELLEKMRQQYVLPALDEGTASLYMQILFENDSLARSQAEFNAAMVFLDRLENEHENQEIVSILEATEEDSLPDLRVVTEIVSPSHSNRAVAPMNSGINLFAAQRYAERHAKPTTFNRNYGYERLWNGSGADCTNFASQILHAGGVKMVHSSSKYSGWWFKSQWNRSVSWINTNTFKNYMGSGYSTKYWSSLVSNVRNGDFIGLDFGPDGEVDHIGFVHTKSQGSLRIAQHSSDYISWQHGWANSSGVGTYYRIRR